VPKFDPNTPSIARVYDYVLGGKDNFAADRELGDQLLASLPMISEQAAENRQFLARAAAWTAGQGIRQFLDLGCGLPTTPNTHESVQAVSGDARVVYVDTDPIVVNHLHATFAKGNPHVCVVDGDVREVAAILDGVRAGLDLSAPTCLIAGFLLHFFTADAARDLMASYTAALAPGSYVVISVIRPAETEAVEESLDTYSAKAAPIFSHRLPDIASFFGDLELVQPGIVNGRQWRPGWELSSTPRADNFVVVGVARKR
jgi:O-methyltransferase involved in polyketide biosynthesis